MGESDIARPQGGDYMLAKYTMVAIGGKTVHLAYTVAAMFEIEDILGEEDLFEALLEQGKRGLETFCEIVSILSRCAETARKAEGHEAGYIASKEFLLACMSPTEYLACKKAAMDAIMLGYGREIIDENEEVDLGLAELEKKENRPRQTC